MPFSYIKWTKATFKAGGHASHIDQLYERCLCALRKQALSQYCNDDRYLKLWIAYVRYRFPCRSPLVDLGLYRLSLVVFRQADLHEDPRDFFSFMHEQKIGLELSLFYRYYTYMETNRDTNWFPYMKFSNHQSCDTSTAEHGTCDDTSTAEHGTCDAYVLEQVLSLSFIYSTPC